MTPALLWSISLSLKWRSSHPDVIWLSLSEVQKANGRILHNVLQGVLKWWNWETSLYLPLILLSKWSKMNQYRSRCLALWLSIENGMLIPWLNYRHIRRFPLVFLIRQSACRKQWWVCILLDRYTIHQIADWCLPFLCYVQTNDERLSKQKDNLCAFG